MNQEDDKLTILVISSKTTNESNQEDDKLTILVLSSKTTYAELVRM